MKKKLTEGIFVKENQNPRWFMDKKKSFCLALVSDLDRFIFSFKFPQEKQVFNTSEKLINNYRNHISNHKYNIQNDKQLNIQKQYQKMAKTIWSMTQAIKTMTTTI